MFTFFGVALLIVLSRKRLSAIPPGAFIWTFTSVFEANVSNIVNSMACLAYESSNGVYIRQGIDTIWDKKDTIMPFDFLSWRLLPYAYSVGKLLRPTLLVHPQLLASFSGSQRILESALLVSLLAANSNQFGRLVAALGS